MKAISPHVARNRDPILAVLKGVLAPEMRVLEIASGTGEHAVFFARELGVHWQPSDRDPRALASISTWVAESGNPRLLPPLTLDAANEPWDVEAVDAIVAINLIHISPWESCVGLLRNAGRILPENGALILYGPFFRKGTITAPSNLEFDRFLRSQNPDWGVREMETVLRIAEREGLATAGLHEMPSNNLTLILQKTP